MISLMLVLTLSLPSLWYGEWDKIPKGTSPTRAIYERDIKSLIASNIPNYIKGHYLLSWGEYSLAESLLLMPSPLPESTIIKQLIPLWLKQNRIKEEYLSYLSTAQKAIILERKGALQSAKRLWSLTDNDALLLFLIRTAKKEGQPKKAGRLLLSIRRDFKRWKEAYQNFTLSPELLLRGAEYLYNKKQFKSAKVLILNALPYIPRPLLARAHLLAGKILVKTRNYTLARQHLKRVKKHPVYQNSATFWLAVIEDRCRDYQKALALYKEVTDTHPEANLYIALILETYKDWKDASKYLLSYLELRPKEEYFIRLAIYYYLAGDTLRAVNTLRNSPYYTSTSHLYWRARWLKEMGTENDSLLKAIMEKFPPDYYTYIAVKRFKIHYPLPKVADTMPNRPPSSISQWFYPPMRRWLDIIPGCESLSTLEKCYLWRKNGFMKQALSIATVAWRNSQDPNLLTYAFPVVYPEIIFSTQMPDPFLILSLLREESLFHPIAVSWAGARGIAQIMPETARKYGVDADSLIYPSVAIPLCIKILQDLQKELPHIPSVLAGYNAGSTRTKFWLSYCPEDEEIFTELIPYRETRRYVKKVLRDYFVYSSIYNKEWP